DVGGANPKLLGTNRVRPNHQERGNAGRSDARGQRLFRTHVNPGGVQKKTANSVTSHDAFLSVAGCLARRAVSLCPKLRCQVEHLLVCACTRTIASEMGVCSYRMKRTES